MKSVLIIASFIALAVANPVYRDIAVGPAILDFEPIAISPAVVETRPISVGPAVIDTEPISVGPAIVEETVIVPAGTSHIQFALDFNGVTYVFDAPISVAAIEAIGTPILPVVIGDPQLPSPTDVLPKYIN